MIASICLRVHLPAFETSSGAFYCTTMLTEIQVGESGALCAIYIRSILYPLWIYISPVHSLFFFPEADAELTDSTEQKICHLQHSLSLSTLILHIPSSLQFKLKSNVLKCLSDL